MSVSLNAEKHEIAYDTRIDYYIDLYKFAGELDWNASLGEKRKALGAGTPSFSASQQETYSLAALCG